MSCDLTLGYAEPCKQYIGGIDEVYFVNFGDLGTLTIADDEITDASGTFSAYKYVLKANNNTFVENGVSDRETGTFVVTQTLTLNLKGLTKAMHKEMKLLAYGRPHVVIVDRMGNARLMGRVRGVEANVDSATGGAMTDMTGYTLTIVGTEPTFANFIASPAAGDPFDGLTSATATIVTAS